MIRTGTGIQLDSREAEKVGQCSGSCSSVNKSELAPQEQRMAEFRGLEDLSSIEILASKSNI